MLEEVGPSDSLRWALRVETMQLDNSGSSYGHWPPQSSRNVSRRNRKLKENFPLK